MQTIIRTRIAELFAGGDYAGVAGWQRGLLPRERTPAYWPKESGLTGFAYDQYCGANLVKHLIRWQKEWAGVNIVLLRPCESYNFNLLLQEHQLERARWYLVGLPCPGMLDPATDAPLAKCQDCKGPEQQIYDEVLDCGPESPGAATDRFAAVAEIAALPAAARFAFFQRELSRCLRCNACRNACPACNCRTCIFDNRQSAVAATVSSDPCEDQLFHLIRAYHVAGRCTDCGECGRVCPQGIPLQLLNRRLILELDTNYGPYQAGAAGAGPSPLTAYDLADPEPDAAREGGRQA